MQGRIGAAIRGTGVILGSMPVVADAQATAQRFDIPVQPLDSAIRQVARTAHAQVLFDDRAIAGKNSLPVAGFMTVEQALKRIAANSHLTVSHNGRAFVIGAAAATSSA